MRLAEVRSMANGVLFSSRKAYQHHEKRLDPNNVNHTCSRSSSLYLSFHQSRTQRHEILFPPAYQSKSFTRQRARTAHGARRRDGPRNPSEACCPREYLFPHVFSLSLFYEARAVHNRTRPTTRSPGHTVTRSDFCQTGLMHLSEVLQVYVGPETRVPTRIYSRSRGLSEKFVSPSFSLPSTYGLLRPSD